MVDQAKPDIVALTEVKNKPQTLNGYSAWYEKLRKNNAKIIFRNKAIWE